MTKNRACKKENVFELYYVCFYSGSSLGMDVYNVPEHGNADAYLVIKQLRKNVKT